MGELILLDKYGSVGMEDCIRGFVIEKHILSCAYMYLMTHGDNDSPDHVNIIPCDVIM